MLAALYRRKSVPVRHELQEGRDRRILQCVVNVGRHAETPVMRSHVMPEAVSRQFVRIDSA